MSKIRGIVPLFLATAIGIGNGLWVFGPALKEQKEKEEQEKETIKTIQNTSDAAEIRDVEAASSRASTNELAMKPIQSSASWWPKSTSMPKEENGTTIKSATEAPNDSINQAQARSTNGP